MHTLFRHRLTRTSAFTGVVPKFHEPGKLRIIWWTQEGNEGMKDYELHQYALVRDNFDVLLALPEVRRVVIMGYSGQNPYVLGDRGTNPWAEKFGREWKRTKRQQRVTEGELAGERMDASKEGREGRLVDIDAVIEQSDEMEEQARRRDDERIAHENEGLLSGEMV